MHGTYRMHVERGAGFRTVHFAMPVEHPGARRNFLAMSSCLALGAALAFVPANPSASDERMAPQIITLPAPRPAPAPQLAPAAALEASAPPLRRSMAPRLPVPEALPAPVEHAPPPVLDVAPTAPQPVLLVPPVPSRAVPAARTRPAPPPMRKVDIAQVTDEAARSMYVPQLREPGLAAGVGGTLVAKVDAMQVPLPPPLELSGEARTALLAEAPEVMTVRVGTDAVGKVAFRTSETGSIDVQLSGLLDLVADRMAPEEYSRLRGAAAASSYVPLDQLRAIGLSLRYDPVYDELDLSA